MQADDSMMPEKGWGHVTSPVYLPPLPVTAVTLIKGLPGIPYPALTPAALQAGRWGFWDIRILTPVHKGRVGGAGLSQRQQHRGGWQEAPGVASLKAGPGTPAKTLACDDGGLKSQTPPSRDLRFLATRGHACLPLSPGTLASLCPCVCSSHWERRKVSGLQERSLQSVEAGAGTAAGLD